MHGAEASECHKPQKATGAECAPPGPRGVWITEATEGTEDGSFRDFRGAFRAFRDAL